MYKIINNRTNEIMERAETMAEAKAIREQYNEMGTEKNNYDGFNEYYGTYRIERV